MRKTGIIPQTPTRHPLLLLDHVGFLLNRCGHQIRAMVGRGLQPLGLTPRQYGILSLLIEAGPLSQNEIGEYISADRTTMVGLIDELEEQHYVKRDVHPEDRRAYAVRITSKGKEICAEAREIAIRINSEYLSKLLPQERRRLHHLLKKLALARDTETVDTGLKGISK